jgi:alkylation response protein AidB-like acyl-CoA dehydrogenase
MDFTIDSTQEQIVNTARDFGREVLNPAEITLDRLSDPAEIFVHPLWKDAMRQAFELGFHKMTLREEFGGLGLDPITVGMVWEELARWGVGFSASLIASSVVPGLVSFLAADNQDLVDRYVIPYCEDTTGSRISGWGSSEPDIGSDGKNYYDPSVHHKTRAVLKDGRYVLNGTKSGFVSNGGVAHSLIAFACVEPERGICGSGAFLVDAASKGFSTGRPERKMGMRTLNQAPLYFDDVEVPEGNMLFPPGDAYPILHGAIITVGNLGTGYLAVGVMRAAYEDALAYARQRVQWGKPIIEHQLVAKRLFDAYAAIESCRALLQKGSWLSKTSFPGDLKTSLTAKILATNAAVRHTERLVQVLGGYGISNDYTLEKTMRDAPLLKIMDGTNDTLMLKAAGLL